MFGRRTQWISLLLLVMFVFGFGGCLLACADDGCASDADAPLHCVIDCDCHALVVAPSAAQPVWSPPLSSLVLSDARLKLPLSASPIFRPPKA